MKKINIFWVFVLLFCAVNSQNKNYFAQDLPFSSEEYKVEYLKLSDSIFGKTSLRTQIKFSKQLYELTKSKNDTLRLIKASHGYARRMQYAGEYLKALKVFKEEYDLISVFKTSNEIKNLLDEYHLSEIEVLCQLGNCFSATNEVELSFEYYHKALDMANDKNLSFYKAVIPSLIGSLKFATDNYDEALRYYNKSLKDLQLADIDSGNIKFNSGLISLYKSQAYLKKKMLDSAQFVIEDAEAKGFFSVGFLGKTEYEISKAEFLLEENKSQEALDLLLKAKEVVDKEDPKFGALSYYNLMAKAYYKLDSLDSAIEIMNVGLAVEETRSDKVYFNNDYKFLAELYKAKGNIEKSNVYLEKYVLNQDAIDKTKKEIINLFHEKEISQLQKEQENQQKFTNYILVGSGLIIIGLVLFLIKFYRKRKKDEETFKQLHAKIKGLTSTNSVLIDTKEADDELEEKSNNDIPEETVSLILNGLKKLEQLEYFLRLDCSSYNVAKRINTNTSYLSKVINSEYQKNFNTYINDLRINYAIVRIENDKMFRSFSIQSIAEELGYKSADSFTKYFKRRTGLNPSFYIKQLKNL